MYCQHCGSENIEGVNFCSRCGTALDPSSMKVPATTGVRLVHYLLDRLFAFIICMILVMVLSLFVKQAILTAFIYIFLLIGYDLFFEYIWQRTPAKWITKTKVVRTDGTKPHFWQMVGRTFARLIPFEAFSFLAGPIGWHDSLSGTLVVPASYSEEDVRNINPSTLPKQKNTLVIIAIAALVGIAVIGLLASVVLLALNSARVKSRDAKRIADVNQIATAVDLYYQDKKTYPLEIETLIPQYLDNIPVAPTPIDGNCTESSNKYQYISDGRTFSIKFCTGGEMNGVPAGNHTVDLEGIH